MDGTLAARMEAQRAKEAGKLAATGVQTPEKAAKETAFEGTLAARMVAPNPATYAIFTHSKVGGTHSGRHLWYQNTNCDHIETLPVTQELRYSYALFKVFFVQKRSLYRLWMGPLANP